MARLAYIAKHDQKAGTSNDDEGSIHHALTALGHDVQRLQERKGFMVKRIPDCDFVLFHKWADVSTIRSLKIPKVFWYFDLVEFPDHTLEARNVTRREWMREITPHVDLGFCTDGDWVDQDKTGKLVWLTQGADQRIAGFGTPIEGNPPPILFTGIRRGGLARSSFVDEMQVNYRQSFNHIERGLHGRELADTIAASKIVVAPDGPVTDRYWSNRVYNMLGFGAFLLHPWSAGVAAHYKEDEEIVFYRSRAELHDKIKYWWNRDEQRQWIAECGYKRTMAEHTYLHRCQRLMEVVEERLL